MYNYTFPSNKSGRAIDVVCCMWTLSVGASWLGLAVSMCYDKYMIRMNIQFSGRQLLVITDVIDSKYEGRTFQMMIITPYCGW